MSEYLGPDISPVSSTMQRTVSALRNVLKAIYHVHPTHDDKAIAATAEALEVLYVMPEPWGSVNHLWRDTLVTH